MNKNFTEALISINGHPEHNEKLKPYQNFIGSWEFEWVGHNEDRTTWTVPGEWHFSWILGGRAIQDIWICPEKELRRDISIILQRLNIYKNSFNLQSSIFNSASSRLGHML